MNPKGIASNGGRRVHDVNFSHNELQLDRRRLKAMIKEPKKLKGEFRYKTLIQIYDVKDKNNHKEV